jgi:HD-GYP domain-containing protein (c-di-GMP phosphodiesterase class II)
MKCFFSVSFDLIVVGKEIFYDLFVNGSASSNEKFIRIFPKGELLASEDLASLQKKYPQLYVPEDQRSLYLKSITKDETKSDVEKVDVIKDNAIQHLNKIFNSGKDFSTELLSETIEDCREAVECMVDVLDDHNIKSLHNLIGDLSFHDFYTFDHSINVSMYCISILQALKPNAQRSELVHAGLGGLLHDLGKVKIPTNILNNPGKLTEEEYDVIKTHPDLGLDLLLNGHCDVSDEIDLEVIAKVVHEHHENWDGKGYPNKIAGEDISFLARVCCVADFFDAITTKRSYSDVLEIEKAIAVMQNTVGKKIDPQIFKVFKKHVKKIVVDKRIEIKLADDFDPTLPYESLPLEKVKIEKPKEDYGKIKMMGDDPKSKKKAS